MDILFFYSGSLQLKSASKISVFDIVNISQENVVLVPNIMAYSIGFRQETDFTMGVSRDLGHMT